MNTHRFRTALARLEDRVERTLVQCRRFETMAAALQTWAAHWSTATFERLLHAEHASVDERERALAALALQGTDEAGALIDAYNPHGAGPDHELFHQVARIEWEQRRPSGQTSGGAPRQASSRQRRTA